MSTTSPTSVRAPRTSKTLPIPLASSSVHTQRNRRLLIPTAHDNPPSAQTISPAVRRVRSTSSNVKLTKPSTSRDGAIDKSSVTNLQQVEISTKPWWSALGKFTMVGQQELEKYQIYAVQKWVVERRLITTLAVYTGNPQDKITVSVIETEAGLSASESQDQLNRAIYDLKRDGARPKDTGIGILMVTSLMNFRSDYTIVLIPGGNYMASRDRLFCNINLLRMGCSGRSALTLEEPNDTTKERFVQTYCFPDSLMSSSSEILMASVLGIVRLLQLCLFFFDLYDVSKWKCDGLLCDATSAGLDKWRSEVGEPRLFLEPPERVADPTLAAALLSTVISVRNKLSDIGMSQSVTKDPFSHPISFSKTVSLFLSSNNSTSSPARLNIGALGMIDTAYTKARQNEAYFKVRRALRHKLDDLSREFLPSSSSAPSQVYPTSDLATLVTIVTRESRAGGGQVASLRKLWTGNFLTNPNDDRDRRRKIAGLDESSDEEEDVLGNLFRRGPVKMQRTLEAWKGWDFALPIHMQRGRKSLSARENLRDSPDPNNDDSQHEASPTNSLLPPMSFAGDHETYGSSSGPESPVKGNDYGRSHLHFSLSPPDHRSLENLEKFNRVRQPQDKPAPRMTSWADPVSATTDIGEVASTNPNMKREISYTANLSPVMTPQAHFEPVEFQAEQKRINFLRRRHSFNVLLDVHRKRVLPIEHMKIDVDLCWELLVSRVRERQLKDLFEIWEIMEESTSLLNDSLAQKMAQDRNRIDDLKAKEQVFLDVVDLQKRIEMDLQEAKTTRYQAQQIATEKLWSNIQSHRLAVARERAKVYRPRKRDLELEELWHSQGRLDRVLPSNSKMKYTADTIDDRKVYIDARGLTEEELAEEEDLHQSDGADGKEKMQTRDDSIHGVVHRQEWGWSHWLLSQVKRLEGAIGLGPSGGNS